MKDKAGNARRTRSGDENRCQGTRQTCIEAKAAIAHPFAGPPHVFLPRPSLIPKPLKSPAQQGLKKLCSVSSATREADAKMLEGIGIVIDSKPDWTTIFLPSFAPFHAEVADLERPLVCSCGHERRTKGDTWLGTGKEQ
ncbi:hypothetical protein PM082_021459 [Marasmius tenuissimus]|nr:hypothetical protein PM082_021459 [Marasmius tenuissimus]